MDYKEWPDFLVIGAQKAGSTSLYHYLKQSKDIFLPGQKEFHFFSSFDSNNSSQLESYQRNFKPCLPNQIAGEISPSYIVSDIAIESIDHFLNNPKLIAVLRQPVERAYSNFLHARREGIEKFTDFEKAIDDDLKEKKLNKPRFKNYIEKGFYYKHLKKYFDRFGSENIHIIFSDDLKNSPLETVNSCLDFLEVSALPKLTERSDNKGKVPKFGFLRPFLKLYYRKFARRYKWIIPKKIRTFFKDSLVTEFARLDDEVRVRLTHEYYIEDIENLEKLLGRDLTNWKK